MTTVIQNLPTPPTPADTPAEFNSKAFSLLGALPGFVTQTNQLGGEMTSLGLEAGQDAEAARLHKEAAAGSAGSAAGSASAASTSAGQAAGAASAADTAKMAAESARDAAAGYAASIDPASLRNRANHTGEQAISTVTDLQTALDSKVDKVAGKSLSTEDYTSAEKAKLSGIAANATANATDTDLRDRTTHTGTQAITTITGVVGTMAGGAVIERGSNANGEYVKFADGTQICTNSVNMAAISVADGSVWRTPSVTWTFPATFTATPAVHITPRVNVNYIWGAIGASGTTTNTAAVSAYSPVSSSGMPLINVTAIGRWK